jgi:hypothetical protein
VVVVLHTLARRPRFVKGPGAGDAAAAAHATDLPLDHSDDAVV